MKLSANTSGQISRDAFWEDYAEGFLDTDEFKSYAEQVRRAIEDLGEPNTRDIKQHFEGDHDRLADALEMLEGEGSICKTRDCTPLRWAVKDRPVRATIPYQNQLGPLSSKPDIRPFATRRVREL